MKQNFLDNTCYLKTFDGNDHSLVGYPIFTSKSTQTIFRLHEFIDICDLFTFKNYKSLKLNSDSFKNEAQTLQIM